MMTCYTVLLDFPTQRSFFLFDLLNKRSRKLQIRDSLYSSFDLVVAPTAIVYLPDFNTRTVDGSFNDGSLHGLFHEGSHTPLTYVYLRLEQVDN